MFQRSMVHSRSNGGCARLAGDESRDAAGRVGGEQASEVFLKDVTELSLQVGFVRHRWKAKWEINSRRRLD